MSTESEETALYREYSPSMWSKRFATAAEVVDHHVNHVTIESEKATNSIPNKLEIEYGPMPGQKLDILGTDLPDDAPILVFIHGGYWHALSREVSRYPALSLYRCGVKVIVVGYDLCPHITVPEIVRGIYDAARFVFGYAEKNNSRGVYFMGHSAGAHLVAKILSNADLLGSTPGVHRLQGAFLISGIFDLRELVNTPENHEIQLPPEWARYMSPIFDNYTHLVGRRLRIYVIVGQNDSPTFIRQSREFFELLHDTCLTQNLYFEVKDKMDHFDIIECLSNADNYLRNLLFVDIGKFF